MLSVTIIINLDTIKKIILSSKKKEKDVGRKSQNEKYSIASVVEEASILHRVLSVTIFDARSWDEWVLESGCSYHICPDMDWFVTYQPVDGNNILIRNNMPCKIIAIGSIKIRMHNNTVRSQGNVRHVPDLKKIWFFWAPLTPTVINFQPKVEFWELNDLLLWLKERRWIPVIFFKVAQWQVLPLCHC